MDRLLFTDKDWSTHKKLAMLQLGAGGALNEYEIEGNPAVFDTNVAKPLTQLLIPFAPVQDLHGYSNPWPAGGGKNLVDIPTIAEPSAVNTEYTLPTATQSGNYVLSFQVNNAKKRYEYVTSVVIIYYGDNTDEAFDTSEIKRVSDDQPMEDASASPITGRYYLKVSNKVITKITFFWRSNGYMKLSSGSVTDIMLESGTSASAYVPYENICPISGWTGVNVARTGVNVWDEVWEVGSINNSTGSNATDDNNIRSKNHILVKPDTEYYIYSGSDINIRYYWYDANKEFISTGWIKNGNVTSPANASFIRVRTTGTYGNTYLNDISVNYPSTETEYHAYSGSTYPVVFPATGKNLYSSSETVNLYKPENGDNKRAKTVSIETIPAGEYDISFKCSVTGGTKVNIILQYFDESVVAVKSFSGVNDNYSEHFSLSQDVNRIYFYISTNQNDGTATISEIQIEKGSASSYEPFTNTTYGGELDATTGMLTVTRKSVQVKDLSWSYYNTAVYASISGMKAASDQTEYPICDRYRSVGNASGTGSAGTWVDNTIRGRDTGGVVYVKDTRYTSASAFKTAEGDMLICYTLAEPLEIQLDPLTVQALIGTNVVFSDTNGINTIKYLKKG